MTDRPRSDADAEIEQALHASVHHAATAAAGLGVLATRLMAETAPPEAWDRLTRALLVLAAQRARRDLGLEVAESFPNTSDEAGEEEAE